MPKHWQCLCGSTTCCRAISLPTVWAGCCCTHLALLHPDLFQARAVTLGTPHQGSQTAQHLHQILPYLLGGAWQNALDGTLPHIAFPVEYGNIAGTLPTGIGRLFAHLLQLNDGTVALAETHLTGSVSLRVPCGHTGLLFDKTVAKHIAYFLQHGRFDTTEQVTRTKN